MPAESYYDVLGVSRDADDAEIKKAYRRLAKKYHPDVSKEENAEEKFKEVGAAYEALKDAESRAIYDRFGASGIGNQQAGRRNQWTYSDLNMEELLRRFHEMNRDNPSYQSAGGVVRQHVTIPYDVMIKGGEAKFVYTAEEASNIRGFVALRQFRASTTLEPNTKVGTEIELPNVPNMKFVLTPTGGNERCVVQGLDILVKIDVDPLRIAIGEKAKVEHPNGKTYEITVPENSQNGTALRLPKMGFTHVNGAQGSLIAVVNLIIPNLSDEQKEALKKVLNGS